MSGVIAVSWISFNHDPFERSKDGSFSTRDGGLHDGPTLDFLLNPASPLLGRVQKLYVLARRVGVPESGARRVDPRDEDVFDALQKVLAERAPHVEVEPAWCEGVQSPIDHRALFRFAARTLGRIRRDHPRADLVVNLSPGTPAMQIAMLLSLQARFAGDRVRAYQSVPRDKRHDEKDVVREVSWNLLGELAAEPLEDESTPPPQAAWSPATARSKAMRSAHALIERFGSVPFPVLIIGARGTGKTEIARRLRALFREWKVKDTSGQWSFHLNCAEFTGDPTMLRSALFGHVKGAHSTALREQEGLLEKAAGDCIFLDEIHWMDPQAQGLLLLALQREGTFRRIGSDKPIRAAFRLIAATNQSRASLRNALTADFLDRISDLIIELPELHTCPEDLGSIWRSVVHSACEELLLQDRTRASATSTQSATRLAAEFKPHHAKIEVALASMRLPGNFRDLERLARRLLVGGLQRGRSLAIGDVLVRDELEWMRRQEWADAEIRTGGESLLDELPTVARCEAFLRQVRNEDRTISSTEFVEEWERRLLVAAQNLMGSGRKAAQLLSVPQRTFSSKLEKLSGVEKK